MSIYYILIVLLAAGGFSISLYVRLHKATEKTLVCPIGHTCDTVIHSDYSRFFGINVEYLGMVYYGLITLSYLAILLRPELALPSVTFGLVAITAAAFLFSLYLTFIQAFALRQWCTWCLFSAGISTLIFALTLFGVEYSFVTLIAGHHMAFLALHLLGFALGVGGATISDIMFFKFLKDLRISQLESDVLHTLSQIIWLGLGLAILSGIGLYIPNAAALNESAKFLVKIIVVSVVVVNGALLNLYIAPKLVRITFGESHEHMAGELRHARKAAFAMGAISIISWYSAAFLGFLNRSPASFGTILAAYLGLLTVGIVLSQILEKNPGRRVGANTDDVHG